MMALVSVGLNTEKSLIHESYCYRKHFAVPNHGGSISASLYNTIIKFGVVFKLLGAIAQKLQLRSAINKSLYAFPSSMCYKMHTGWETQCAF